MSAARCGFLRARALPFGLARARFCLRSDLLLRMQAFRKILAPGGAIPLLVRLVLDLSLDEEISELAALRFALEWHRLTSLRLPEGARHPSSDRGPSAGRTKPARRASFRTRLPGPEAVREGR